MHKVLLIDDEPMIRKMIQEYAQKEDLVFLEASDGAEALTIMEKEEISLAVLDVMMPNLDGWATLREIRRVSDIPVIILTARGEVDDRVKGLRSGGDDYLVKPFAFSELLARVRTLLRRGSKIKEPEVLRAADLELDLLRRRVSRGGQKIDLTSKEFALLELLLRRQGEVLPRSLIASQVWDMSFDSDTNVIEVAVRRLRAKVDDGFEPKLIHTVRGMGYVLEEGR